MKVYITRHGETKWNQEGRMQGCKNSNLSSKGIENAKQLGDYLKEIPFDYIYCSPLGRAMETAQHIIGDRSLEIIPCEALREMNFGIWEGMTHTDVEKLYPQQKEYFWKTPMKYQAMEGESFASLLERANSFIEKMKQLKDAENVLVISHAICIKALYAVIKGYTLNEFWTPPFIQGTSLTILNIHEGIVEIEVEADTSYLL